MNDDERPNRAHIVVDFLEEDDICAWAVPEKSGVKYYRAGISISFTIEGQIKQCVKSSGPHYKK